MHPYHPQKIVFIWNKLTEMTYLYFTANQLVRNSIHEQDDSKVSAIMSLWGYPNRLDIKLSAFSKKSIVLWLATIAWMI